MGLGSDLALWTPSSSLSVQCIWILGCSLINRDAVRLTTCYCADKLHRCFHYDVDNNSDCLPITLFEAADLWKEGYLTRFPPGAGQGLPQKHPLHRKRDYVNRPDVVYTQHRVDADRQGQGVLLVTEPHSELNAGLVVVFSSSHPPIFDWADWTRRCRRLPDTEFDSLLATASETVVQEFLGFFLALCCLGQVPGGAPFSQRSELATACTNRMQIKN